MFDSLASPTGDFATVNEAVSWYKNQYEQLELELQAFRASSGELEAELEKDLEEKERLERQLKGKVESLQYEVDEWKAKYRQAKAEATSAQNMLEKEITTLRDSNRSLLLKLRDIEVANDDYERQARNTTSSLEDLESKYNVAIERGVMMEEEIKIGEQERERLRIEAQHLREELSDLKVEAEILQDKLKKQESRQLSTISTDLSIADSPTFDQCTESTTASSPLLPGSDTAPSPTRDPPPSPPISDTSMPPLPKPLVSKPLTARKQKLPSVSKATNTAKFSRSFTSSVGPPRPGTRVATHSAALGRTPQPKPAPKPPVRKVPTSNSLTHIRSLTAQVQRLEARVHNARSKLPAPTATPPRYSPRSSMRSSTNSIPATITLRSRKKTTESLNSAPVLPERTPTFQTSSMAHVSRASMSGMSRLSYGVPGPTSPTTPNMPPESARSRPSSRAGYLYYRPPSQTDNRHQRAPSRTDIRPPSRTDMAPPPRPISRAGTSTSMVTPHSRPRSSLSNSVYGRRSTVADIDEEPAMFRRSTTSHSHSVSSIPIPAPSGIPKSRRQSGSTTPIGNPLRRPSVVTRTLDELGETF